jgi:hypothetical protein
MFVRVLQNDPNWHTGIVYPVPYAIDRKKLANILVTGGLLGLVDGHSVICAPVVMMAATVAPSRRGQPS